MVSWTEKTISSLSPLAPENLVLLDGFGRPVPRTNPLILYIQAESSIWSFLADSSPSSHFFGDDDDDDNDDRSIMMMIVIMMMTTSIHTVNRHQVSPKVPSLSGHAIACRWCLPPRVRRHRARSLQPILSACPLHNNNSGCGKREVHIITVTCKGSTRYWNYLKDYWPCAGGLSAVSAIGTQLRDPIKSGLARWRMAV